MDRAETKDRWRPVQRSVRPNALRHGTKTHKLNADDPAAAPATTLTRPAFDNSHNQNRSESLGQAVRAV
jgi:hypothetical protein